MENSVYSQGPCAKLRLVCRTTLLDMADNFARYGLNAATFKRVRILSSHYSQASNVCVCFVGTQTCNTIV